MQLKTEINLKIDNNKAINASKKALEELMYIMEGEAVRNCPVLTGRLKASIHLDKINDFKWILADGVDYGIYVEYGTSPHLIRPREKKALKFKKDNKTIFAKEVHHPGTNAQPFFRPALDYTKKKVPFILKKYLK